MNRSQSQFRKNLLRIQKAFFEEKAAAFDLDMAFLYGSWAGGYPRKDSDIDVALHFSPTHATDEAIFDRLTDISLSFLCGQKKRSTRYPFLMISENLCCTITPLFGVCLYILEIFPDTQT